MEGYTLVKNIDTRKTDIIVAGGGPAGFAAAVTAAVNGADVLLVEKLNCLGGMGTAGLVGPFMPTDGAKGGIYGELIKRLKKGGAVRNSRDYRIPNCFDTEQYKYTAQVMCEEAGVNFLFNSYIADVICEDRVVRGIVIANKRGLQAVEAQVIIDATGDGDVAYYAGAGYQQGDENGICQPTSYMFNIGGLKSINLSEDDKERLKEQLALARKQGRITLPQHVDSIWNWTDSIGEGSTIRDGEATINIDMTAGIDATDPEALTQAELDGRRYIRECMWFFRMYIPGAEDAYITKTACLHGVRETRRILGKYYLTAADVLNGSKFEDGICKASFCIDVHGPARKKSCEEWKLIPFRCLPWGDWYEIPYRSLVPESIGNMLVAGRCISSDHAANGSLRVMPTCMCTGQAAGMAAAMALKKGISPGDLDGVKVREVLIASGADL